jgi:regulatory protein
MEFSTETWHFAADGAVTPIVLVVQDKVMSDRATARADLIRMAAAAQVQDSGRQQKGAGIIPRRDGRGRSRPRHEAAEDEMSAYLDGVKMLARRELSELQVRQRLARKGHEPDAIDEAIARLRELRAIDDTRVADAIARTETAVRRRGKLRVRLQIQRAGISNATAKRAVDDVFDTIDDAALLEASLAKRLRGRETIADDREFQRLYRYLIGQGFESDRVMKALSSRRR